MTPEELLKPRYLVIADYPGSIYDTGNILEEMKEQGCFVCWGRMEDGTLSPSTSTDLSKYPHLFKPLQWWELREEKDMPEYLKGNHIGFFEEGIYKVKHYSGKGGVNDHVRFTDEQCGYLGWFLPSNETEYLTNKSMI